MRQTYIRQCLQRSTILLRLMCLHPSSSTPAPPPPLPPLPPRLPTSLPPQANKRQAVQASVERLESGLTKLRKTQADVDVLVEQARLISGEVEQKVSAANKFAEEVRGSAVVLGLGLGQGRGRGPRCCRSQKPREAAATEPPTAVPICPLPCLHTPPSACLPLQQVGVEKGKVNAENAAAQVEADACAEIAKEVTELQARCEGELAAAEPLVAQAEEALNTLTKKDLGGCSEPAHSCLFCWELLDGVVRALGAWQAPSAAAVGRS